MNPTNSICDYIRESVFGKPSSEDGGSIDRN